ncbi:peroxisomal acyl-coenzyme A thioester hydrolase [Yamadazyma tenuis]|uniref:Thioesterase/thiol ester dehydrase-isomerase n=1 Tax=Candida tenuis (strain ATCC 10573 / BCRC 21748 / CBS 615 / JCM 9827 / NBRC 10315 / NRRL Y-1498 / VKM Y-70) TaxID=590646 RepID=G3B3G4_CANTC|nr:Thioesterase/thiol ester dehydrase-isomerase [Yamadazyma tenuis ATCC 10573]EGV64157.1 Thioesterase/thiol ester dehydrase-isomerase [Yamadazyma tenuis ATCC 10573]WEJ96196.1 peroxisomal acyl-coenzyme A thioester hydrolase [Yamadazyma tenuis]
MVSLQQVYENRDQCVMEEKFSLLKVDGTESTYVGKYPLEPYMEGARGTYGGEVIAQSALAAYETVTDSTFQLSSLHSYFLKAGSHESPMRYEVLTTSAGKSFTSKTVNVYQSHNNQHVLVMTCLFAANNSISQRQSDYKSGKSKRFPYQFQSSPGSIFSQYRKGLEEMDDLIPVQHTHDLVEHALPRLYLEKPKKLEMPGEIGDRRLGFFTRILDELPQDAAKVNRIKVADLLYLSDSLYLGLIMRTLGFPISPSSHEFFRVSLDHSVFIHDMDFDPTNYMFVGYRFVRMSNSRVLCFVQFFDLDGKQIATVTQEGLIDLPKYITDGVKL